MAPGISIAIYYPPTCISIYCLHYNLILTLSRWSVYCHAYNIRSVDYKNSASHTKCSKKNTTHTHTSVEQLLGKEITTARIAMILYVVCLLLPLMVTGKMNVSEKCSVPELPKSNLTVYNNSNKEFYACFKLESNKTICANSSQTQVHADKKRRWPCYLPSAWNAEIRIPKNWKRFPGKIQKRTERKTFIGQQLDVWFSRASRPFVPCWRRREWIRKASKRTYGERWCRLHDSASWFNWRTWIQYRAARGSETDMDLSHECA